MSYASTAKRAVGTPGIEQRLYRGVFRKETIGMSLKSGQLLVPWVQTAHRRLKKLKKLPIFVRLGPSEFVTACRVQLHDHSEVDEVYLRGVPLVAARVVAWNVTAAGLESASSNTELFSLMPK